MQNYVFNKYGDKLPLNYGLQGAQSLHMKYVQEDEELKNLEIHLPDHSYINELIGKFKHAIDLYKEGNQGQAAAPWVLFVCEDDERNICDQKVIEIQLQR